ncbi:PREDICTED: uncharacterized protein LOC105452395 [Wasmannia auropunctata]|uniref:uncharacterized protein LOC105452395 n=1 Tax=Wasmannia auropunctata TaxID=64793 RepID=UPI0005ED72D7|nr:PREDICTED: uncharacterized protein LOC105452395 [Wasmannia auropunctata]
MYKRTHIVKQLFYISLNKNFKQGCPRNKCVTVKDGVHERIGNPARFTIEGNTRPGVSTVQETVVTQSIVYLHRGQLATVVIERTAQSDNLLLTKRGTNTLNETARTIDRLSRFLTETGATRFSSQGS